MRERVENPVMTFPINTELFIGRTTALYRGETQIKVLNNKGDQLVGINWLEDQILLALKCYLGVYDILPNQVFCLIKFANLFPLPNPSGKHATQG